MKIKKNNPLNLFDELNDISVDLEIETDDKEPSLNTDILSNDKDVSVKDNISEVKNNLKVDIKSDSVEKIKADKLKDKYIKSVIKSDEKKESKDNIDNDIDWKNINLENNNILNNKNKSFFNKIRFNYNIALFLSAVWICASLFLFIPSSADTFASMNILQIFGVICIIILPILTIFFISYCIDRIRTVKMEQSTLYPFLEMLLDNDKESVSKISDAIADNIQAQINIISDKAKNILKLYSNAIQFESDSATLSLRKQMEQMTLSTIEISKNTDTVKNEIRQQTSELNDLLVDFSKNSKDMLAHEDMLTKIYGRLNEIAKRAVGDVKSIGILTSELENKSELIEEASDKTIEGISKISSVIDERVRDFVRVVGDLNNTAKASDELIKNSIKGIDMTINNIDSLTEKTKQISDYTKVMEETIASRANELSSVVNVVSTQTRLGEASLQNQARLLENSADTLLQKIDDANKKISISINNVVNLSNRAGESLNETHQQVISNAKEISNAIKENILMTDASFSNFKKISDNVIDTAKEISATINKSLTDLKQDSVGLTVMLDKLQSSTNTEFDLALKNRNAEFEKVFLNINEKMADIIKNLRNAEDNAKNTINSVSDYTNNFGKSIDSKIKEFMQAYDALKSSSTVARDDISKLVNDIKDNAKIISETISKSGIGINQVVADKKLSANVSNNQNQSVNLSVNKANFDQIINETGFIIERLGAISVDIGRILNPDVQSELWEKYYAGNRTIFAKYIAKTITPKQKEAIKRMYINNAEFKNYVDKFISEFDILMLKSLSSEKGKLLTFVITGTDVGKVYMLLKETIK